MRDRRRDPYEMSREIPCVTNVTFPVIGSNSSAPSPAGRPAVELACGIVAPGVKKHRAVQSQDLYALLPRAIGWVLILIFLLASVPLGAATQSGPRDTVDEFHTVLVGVMQRAEQLGFSGRRDILAPVIEERFDLPYIARIALGRRHWTPLNEGQRTNVVDTFSRLSIATYASRFDGYAGEQFVFVEERQLKRGRTLVRTELRESDGGVVQLDYVLHPVDGGWRIVNVIADGVSDLSLKRADYGAVMKTDGFEALIAKLEAKIAEYAAD